MLFLLVLKLVKTTYAVFTLNVGVKTTYAIFTLNVFRVPSGC